MKVSELNTIGVGDLISFRNPGYNIGRVDRVIKFALKEIHVTNVVDGNTLDMNIKRSEIVGILEKKKKK
jgi:hypothetical protein